VFGNKGVVFVDMKLSSGSFSYLTSPRALAMFSAVFSLHSRRFSSRFVMPLSSNKPGNAACFARVSETTLRNGLSDSTPSDLTRTSPPSGKATARSLSNAFRASFARRAIRYGDGWIPGGDIREVLPKFRDMAKEAGRDPASIEITSFALGEDLDRVKRLNEMGVARVVPMFPPEKADEVLPIVDRWTKIMKQVNG
jgi:hypothetical protein